LLYSLGYIADFKFGLPIHYGTREHFARATPESALDFLLAPRYSDQAQRWRHAWSE
jgi:hypothetical protein